MRLCDHPRARRQIELARGWGGIGAFALVGTLSLDAGNPLLESGFRALLAGMVAYACAWGLALIVWRHLAVAEVEAARASAEARRAALLEEIERRSGGAPSSPNGQAP